MKTFGKSCTAGALLGLTALFAAAEEPRDTYSKDGWKLVWSEEFEKSGMPSREDWKPEVGFVRNEEPQYYTDMRPENCRIEDGALVITALREQWANPKYSSTRKGWKYERKFADYTSASLQSMKTFRYGRIEIRAQLPNDQGAWPALWTLGACRRKDVNGPEYYDWPGCGEIDLVEIWGRDPCRVAACVHTSKNGLVHRNMGKLHKKAGGGDRVFDGPGENPSEGYHVYTLDWYEDRLVMFYDGKLYGTADLAKSDWPEGGNPFRKPHFLLINLALGGWKNEVRNEPVTDAKTGKVLPATRFPMVMKVDYVRHYERIGNICEKNNGGK